MGGSLNWPIELVDLSRLRLDKANVRIRGSVSDEDSVLAHLYQDEDVLTLVRDIARDGYFDNEQPIVYGDGDGFVVMEGNRRVSALKGLDEPQRIPAFEQRLRAAIARAEEADFPTQIRVMVAPSRESTLPVIARLHTRDSKKSWILEQQATFYYDRVLDGATVAELRQSYPAEAGKIPRFVLMGQMVAWARAAAATDPVAVAFIDSRAFKMTTFEYLYNSSVFRKALGLIVNQDGLPSIAGRDAEFLRRLFIQIVLDMKDKRINTRNLRVTEDSHKLYVASLLEIADGLKESHDEKPLDDNDEVANEDEVADDADDDADADADEDRGREKTDEQEQNDVDESTVSDDSETDTSNNVEESPETGEPSSTDDEPAVDLGTSRAPRKQRFDERLDFDGMPMQLPSIGMRTRYEELHRINVKNFPNATFDIMRTFIECAIKAYFVSANDPVVRGGGQGGPIQLSHCLAHVDSRLGKDSTVARGLTIMRSRQFSNPDTYLASALAFNDSNHDPDVVFNYEQVNSMWAQISPFVKLLLAGPPRSDQPSEGIRGD
ncbi:MAG: hypothetical protein KF761_14480 [Salinibacterium sp.]|nr:hypothetical protein [Salinibacterium sp.]